MSAALRAISAARDMAFNPSQKEDEEVKGKKNDNTKCCSELIQAIQVPKNETDLEVNDNDTDEETEEESDLTKLEAEKELHPGPLFSLKDQLEKDKVCHFFIFLCLCMYIIIIFWISNHIYIYNTYTYL